MIVSSRCAAKSRRFKPVARNSRRFSFHHHGQNRRMRCEMARCRPRSVRRVCQPAFRDGVADQSRRLTHDATPLDHHEIEVPRSPGWMTAFVRSANPAHRLALARTVPVPLLIARQTMFH